MAGQQEYYGRREVIEDGEAKFSHPFEEGFIYLHIIWNQPGQHADTRVPMPLVSISSFHVMVD